MAEESTTSDLVELSRRLVEAGNRHDFDAVMSFYAPVAIWAEGLIERVTMYSDIDEARVAAERLAGERG
jgi:hypothetical protein